MRRNEFDFHPVGVFAVQRVVARAAGVRILAVVEQRHARLAQPRGGLVDLRPRTRMKGEVVQAHALAVVAGLQMCRRRLHETQVGGPGLVARAFGPAPPRAAQSLD